MTGFKIFKVVIHRLWRGFYLLSGLMLLLVLSCNAPDTTVKKAYHYPSLIPEYPFRNSDFEFPVAAAHRGTPHISGYPENSMESMRYLDQYRPMLLEVDVRRTVDGELILFHDKTLERTTTGVDEVAKYDIDEVQQLLLKDPYGRITDFHVPLLRKMLRFNKDRTEFVIMLDIKQGVDFKEVAKIIRETGQEKNVILIVYSASAAVALHRIIPEVVISVPVRNMDEWYRLTETNVPLDRVIAFTGTIRSEDQLFDTLMRHDIAPIIGTLGNIDKQAERSGVSVYQQLADQGVKVFSTDRPLEVFQWLESEYYTINE